MKVLKAEYGGVDVIEKVNSLIKSDGLSFIPSNSIFGDVAPGIRKKFYIEYQTSNKIEKKEICFLSQNFGLKRSIYNYLYIFFQFYDHIIKYILTIIFYLFCYIIIFNIILIELLN